ncbi:hypothetical protein [Streptomyces antibioticus]|uniref:hypothetical protein n=1 Tax=Streptomyces antibioticus TaxID=1890 RepID=UPI00340E75DF
MKHCEDQFAPPPEMQTEACQVAGVELDVDPALVLRCELGAHEGPDHAAGIVEAQDHSGRMTWVWWRSGVDVRDPCMARRFGEVERLDNVVCGLFAGHEGEHAWP